MARLTQLRGNGQDQGKVSGPQCVLLRLGGTSEGPFGMTFGGNINS